MSRSSWEFNRGESSDEERLFEEGVADELYDPEADDETERWVRQNLVRRADVGDTRTTRGVEQRGEEEEDGRSGHGTRAGTNVADREFQLTCPCCFTLLCVQSQQHVKYHNQFRAMFVMNCSPQEGEDAQVRVVEEGRVRHQPGRSRRTHDRHHGFHETFRPVACDSCGTNVGVLDNDEVYHFCNVMY